MWKWKLRCTTKIDGKLQIYKIRGERDALTLPLESMALNNERCMLGSDGLVEGGLYCF